MAKSDFSGDLDTTIFPVHPMQSFAGKASASASARA